MKRLTKNRIDLLQHLTQGHPDCGLPPYSVSNIHYMIYGYSDYDIKDVKQCKKIYNSQLGQIRRTLNDLANDGLLIMGRVLSDNNCGDSRLPYWETVYQIALMAEVNHFEAELHAIERKISSAYNGFGTLFGGKLDGKGLSKAENEALTKRVKGIIQQSHPDKGGNEYRFKAMKKCLDMLRKMPVNVSGA